MKLALVLLATALLTGSSAASGAPLKKGVGSELGRDYVRVSDWAKKHDLQIRWLKREETIEISGQSIRVALAVDSQEVDINGVQVRLLFPIIFHDGQAW